MEMTLQTCLCSPLVGREKKGQTGDQTQDFPFHAKCSTTELLGWLLEESPTPTPSVVSLLLSVQHDRKSKQNSHMLPTYLVTMHHCIEYRHGQMHEAYWVV